MKPWKNLIIFLSRDMSIGDVQIYVVSFRSIFVIDNHQPFYPSSNSLQKQQFISGSSVHLQITTLGPTSSFTVIIDLRMYVFFLTQEIKGQRFPPFFVCLVLNRLQCDFTAGTPQNGNEMCFIFSEYSICDHENSWSNDLGNLISMIYFFFDPKKDQRSWSNDPTNCYFYDPWSKKAWSHDYDLSNPVISWLWSEENRDLEF